MNFKDSTNGVKSHEMQRALVEEPSEGWSSVVVVESKFSSVVVSSERVVVSASVVCSSLKFVSWGKVIHLEVSTLGIGVDANLSNVGRKRLSFRSNSNSGISLLKPSLSFSFLMQEPSWTMCVKSPGFIPSLKNGMKAKCTYENQETEWEIFKVKFSPSKLPREVKGFAAWRKHNPLELLHSDVFCSCKDWKTDCGWNPIFVFSLHSSLIKIKKVKRNHSVF